MNEANDNPSQSELILYQTEDLQTQIEVRLEGETVWLSQAQLAELFQTTKQNISLHIRNLFTERELEEDSVVKYYLTTAADGKRYRSAYYNLDVIISVGYRVRSLRATPVVAPIPGRIHHLHPDTGQPRGVAPTMSLPL